MDLEDAFTEEAITALDTNVEGPEEKTLKEIITRVFQTNEINWSDDTVNVAVLCFVAGRTYQSGLESEQTVTIDMTPQTARDFIMFLTQKGAP